MISVAFFFFQAEDGIRDLTVTGVQTCALPISPTVRELDGLALSSRNTYLNGDERRAAVALSRALRAVEQAWRAGEADPKALERRGMAVLNAPGVTPEYLALVDDQLRAVARADARTVVAIAARVGATRLIDNVVLGEGVASDESVRTDRKSVV